MRTLRMIAPVILAALCLSMAPMAQGDTAAPVPISGVGQVRTRLLPVGKPSLDLAFNMPTSIVTIVNGVATKTTWLGLEYTFGGLTECPVPKSPIDPIDVKYSKVDGKNIVTIDQTGVVANTGAKLHVFIQVRGVNGSSSGAFQWKLFKQSEDSQTETLIASSGGWLTATTIINPPPAP